MSLQPIYYYLLEDFGETQVGYKAVIFQFVFKKKRCFLSIGLT